VPDLSVRDRLSPDETRAVRALVERVTEADGVGPLSEHVLLHLPGGGDEGVSHLLLRDDDRLAGYAHLDVTDQVAGSSGELAVDPDARKQGHGHALVEALLTRTPDGRLRLWAHGDSGAAAALAARHGFERSRVLLQMRRPLGEDLPAPRLPDGLAVRDFEPGRDEDAWLEVNARAFADHPEQGRWTRRELDLRLAEPWFDPAGFFLAERAGDSGRPRLVGFHWTKVHGGRRRGEGQHGHPPVGEVYVVGVDPSEQGRGLGAALTLLGLRSLRDRGLDEALLYVDDSNTAAVRTYAGLGFTTSLTDVCYSRA
jgi:mycothiol synthase